MIPHFLKSMILRLAMPIAVLLVVASPAHAAQRNQAAKKAAAAAPAPLSEAGETLLTKYTAQMEALEAEILESLPRIDESRRAAYEKARDAEIAADTALAEVSKGQDEIKKAEDLVARAKGWARSAGKATRKAEAALKAAQTDEQKSAAELKLADARQSRQKGLDALNERRAALAVEREKYAAFAEAIKNAEAELEQAGASTLEAVGNLGIAGLLGSDELDAKLTAYSVMAHATPRGLAIYAQQGADQAKLIDRLLANDELLVQIAVADGAADGNYGAAMEIYDSIQKSSDKAATGILQRLALAIALEHAKPNEQRNAEVATEAPKFVNPLSRYLAYEKAYLGKELDPGFGALTVFDLRFVVCGEEPDDIAAWGRAMLANYRPDHIITGDDRWRYVALVRSDIPYGSQDNQFDEPELQFFQNILKNGGVCGRRAFIGRFLLRAFGVPTIARPQPGHASLARWTPDGWVVCLGAGWGAGSTKLAYGKDLDFLATTQGRATGEAYMQVKRAQWIGTVMGESTVYGFHTARKRLARNEIPFWNAVALYTQRGLIEAATLKTLTAVGQDIGEANVTKEKVEIIKFRLSADDKKIVVDDKGVITIPAAATTEPATSDGKIIFMPSNRGGLQLHYERGAEGKEFTYTIDVPKAGTYDLSAMVCTPSWQQNLIVSVNDNPEPVKLSLPHTVGMWEATASVGLDLKQGENVLKLVRSSDGQPKGLTIHHFTLTPASQRE